MADHKIDGNDGAGNVQALDYDRRQVAHLQAVVDRLNAVIDKHNTDCEDLRAQLAAANARADQAEYRIVHIAAGLFPGGFDNNVAAIRDALRAKPAPSVLPLLPDMVDAATAAGVVVWWDNEAQEIKMAVTVQEAARVLLGVFEDPDANAPHGFDWQSMYDEMTADHKESLDICGTHDWPSTLIVALRAIAEINKTP